jgi:hypothetical protein
LGGIVPVGTGFGAVALDGTALGGTALGGTAPGRAGPGRGQQAADGGGVRACLRIPVQQGLDDLPQWAG